MPSRRDATSAGPQQLVRREHRLVVLLLVLDDHAEREAVFDESPAFEWRPFEHVEHLVAHRPDVGTRLTRPEQRQRRPVASRVLERVVQVVDVGTHRLAPTDVAHQPQLLLIADVRVVPDERRHQRRVLAHQVVGVDGVGERLRTQPGSGQLVSDVGTQGLGAERHETRSFTSIAASTAGTAPSGAGCGSTQRGAERRRPAGGAFATAAMYWRATCRGMAWPPSPVQSPRNSERDSK